MHLGTRPIRTAGKGSGSVEVTLPAQLRPMVGLTCRVWLQDGARPDIVLSPDLEPARAAFAAFFGRLAALLLPERGTAPAPRRRGRLARAGGRPPASPAGFASSLEAADRPEVAGEQALSPGSPGDAPAALTPAAALRPGPSPVVPGTEPAAAGLPTEGSPDGVASPFPVWAVDDFLLSVSPRACADDTPSLAWSDGIALTAAAGAPPASVARTAYGCLLALAPLLGSPASALATRSFAAAGAVLLSGQILDPFWQDAADSAARLLPPGLWRPGRNHAAHWTEEEFWRETAPALTALRHLLFLKDRPPAQLDDTAAAANRKAGPVTGPTPAQTPGNPARAARLGAGASPSRAAPGRSASAAPVKARCAGLPSRVPRRSTPCLRQAAMAAGPVRGMTARAVRRFAPTGQPMAQRALTRRPAYMQGRVAPHAVLRKGQS